MRRRHSIAMVSLATVLATGLTATAFAETPLNASSSSPATTCELDAILQPCPGRVLFGGWSKGYTTGSFQKVVEEAEGRYGRKLDVVHTYHAPDGPSPLPFGKDKFGEGEKQYAAEGRIVLANYKPGTPRVDGAEPYAPDYAATAAGAHDKWIRQTARNIKASGSHKVMLTLQHEPENTIGGGTDCDLAPGNNRSNTPQAYRDMWRHTREVFDDEGVTNVVWVMNYMSYERWDCLVSELWPGDDLVDWIAYDPYSVDGTTSRVTRFAHLLAAKTDESHHFTDKPLMLAEYGSKVGAVNAPEPAREPARIKARAFYDNLGKLLDARTIPKLHAMVIFDSTVSPDGNFGVGQDTWGAPDPKEQEAFNRLAGHPAFVPSVASWPRLTGEPATTVAGSTGSRR